MRALSINHGEITVGAYFIQSETLIEITVGAYFIQSETKSCISFCLATCS
jgi:hypothetical protein